MLDVKVLRRNWSYVLVAGLIVAFVIAGNAAKQAEQSRLQLNTTGGEVWVWQKEVSGSCECGKCAEIVMKVNGKQVKVAQEEGRFGAQVLLDEGDNLIRVACRHEDGSECATREIVFTERLKSRPTARLKIDVSMEKDCVILSGEESAPCERTGARLVKYVWKEDKSNPVQIKSEDYLVLGRDRRIILNPPKVDGEYYFSLMVKDEKGRRDKAREYFVVEGGKPRTVDTDRENAAWIDEAVVYGVLPHLFDRKEPFNGVTDKLDYLKEVGVTALWLGPSTATINGNGYAVADYFELREDYGTTEDFRRMVQEAHKRGIRVMMDFVPNHCSIRHRYMRYALTYGEKSPYYSFFDREGGEGPFTYYFGWQDLPNLNYSNPEVQRWIVEAFSYWVRDLDVDGFRIDAIWGVKERQPDFGLKLRRELTRIKPDIFMLAEASARDGYYFDNGFDAGYDWTDRLGNWAWEELFEDEDKIVERLNEALTNEGRGYHEDALVFHFLNNNDTGWQFRADYGPELTRTAAAMLLSLTGVPCVYTGEEVGANFHPYRTSMPISWEDEYGLLDYYKKLIALRKDIAALHSRKWEILEAVSEQQVYSYVRYGEEKDTPVLVVLNFSDEATTAKIAAPNSIDYKLAGEFKDLLSEESVTIDAGVIELPAYGAYYLTQR